jgi:hypothetical protein
MKKFSLQILVAVMILVTFVSCNETPIDDNVYVDSYIHSIFNASGVPVYAVMHTAYSFKPLSGVVVSGPSVTIQPTNPTGDGFSFYTVIPATSYKTTVPGPGDYSYTSTYQTGESVTKTDATLAKSLEPPRQLDAIKGATDIVISWKAVTDAEGYKLRIFSQDPTTNEKKLIFDSNFLIPNSGSTDLSYPISVISFSQYLTTNLTFEVSAFIFQDTWNYYHAVSMATVTKFFGI